MISYNTENVKMPKISKRATSQWIKAVAESYQKKIGDIAYIFCDDEKILEVNKQYLQNDLISGDIFISLDTVKSNSEEQGTDYDEELHRVIIHGILHLCGINDKGPGERELMEAAENKALEMLQT